MKQEPLKVGFDLDGVILYNPARVARPILAFLRNQVLHKQKKEFYIPTSPFADWLWYVLHKTSLAPSPAYKSVIKLIKDGQIEAYIITGRYHSLESDFDIWLKKLDATSYFKTCVYNKDNEQPHIFKRKMIEKFGIQIFVEDNWDIVRLLNERHPTSPRLRSSFDRQARLRGTRKKPLTVLWITNFLDQFIPYPYKYFSLKRAMQYIEGVLKK